MELIVAGAILLLTFIPRDSSEPQPPPSQNIAQSTSTQTNSPAPTQTTKKPTIHKVETGETLNGIAKKYYGSGAFWTTLWNDNDFIEDPRIIHSGLELKIRTGEQKEPEELSKKLAVIYEEITAGNTLFQGYLYHRME